MFVLSVCFPFDSLFFFFFLAFKAMVMMKGLMGRCLTHEVTLERVRIKAEQTEDELNQLRSWKSKMEKKLELSKRVRKDLEQSTEEAKKALEGKDKEIQDLKDRLRQAKEVAIREYHNFNALLSELGDSFLQGFDDALRQVKKAYPDLDVSNIKVDYQAQASVMLVASKDTDDLFAENEVLGDRESAQAKNVQAQPVIEVAHQPVNIVEQAEDTPAPK